VLTEVAENVFVRQSAFCLTNSVVVRRRDEALLIDPGVDGSELDALAVELDGLGAVVTAGFSTHPHWDHVLWHPRFGDVPRYGTASCAGAAQSQVKRLRRMASEHASGIPLELVGTITELPAGPQTLAWSGSTIRVIEHHAHAPGHAALLITESGVLVAGDMLSDVEIPLFDPRDPDQCHAYATGLDLLEAACDREVTVLVPGHGAVARGSEIRSRIAADRAYVNALVAGVDPGDARVGPDATYGTDWLPEAHEENMRLAGCRIPGQD
jgi:glyoxylase-like metal-dependent hydrolase (beta-lactamase superfamily II)